jgi:hypothetical protein
MSAEQGGPRDVRRRLTWRAMEALVGWLLVAMARLAARDLDLHELQHIGAQMEAGDTSRCGPDCRLRGIDWAQWASAEGGAS